jgi:type II secretory pathway pseudopilin PulG
MRKSQNNFSFIESMMVVAIILVISAIGIQGLLQSVRESERSAKEASSAEYSSVRKMYAESYPASYPAAATVEVISASNTHN